MDFNTESTPLSGMEHKSNNVSVKIDSVYYQVLGGLPIKLGVFSSLNAKKPILSLSHHLGEDSEPYKRGFVASVQQREKVF